MIEKLEKYATLNNVPIIQKEGLNFILNYIKENNVKKILEIGTAIGYSAINMVLVDSDIKITTIERNKDMYEIALKNIADFGFEKQVEVVFIDALLYVPNKKYDLIFIDGAKTKYIEFFEKFSPSLNDNGAIITDNLKFHGYVDSTLEIKSKNLRGLVNKLKKYIDFLKNNNDFVTEFLDIGDGISISKPKILSNNVNNK